VKVVVEVTLPTTTPLAVLSLLLGAVLMLCIRSTLSLPYNDMLNTFPHIINRLPIYMHNVYYLTKDDPIDT